MIKIFHLSTCSTCQRILKNLDLPSGTKFQDIKELGVSKLDLLKMRKSVGSYEAVFSRRAMKYRGMGLHERDLTETDFERLILEEYTFLKRPVIFVNDHVFVGNSKKVVAAAKAAIHSENK
ncbi:MAG: arsenate reductase family protein [Crocinitomicaceae bacterium]